MARYYYTRSQLIRVLEIEPDFLGSLERESIVRRDAPPGIPGEFSDRMLERARVAQNLVHDLDVNVAGAAIIVRLREELLGQRRRMERLLDELGPKGSDPRR
jgi:hypothetical protein